MLEAKQGRTAAESATPLSAAAEQLRAGLKKGTARRGTRGWDDAMLRPEYQHPGSVPREQKLDMAAAAPDADSAAAAVADSAISLDSEQLARRFSRADSATVAELLATLAALGHVRQLPDGRFR